MRNSKKQPKSALAVVAGNQDALLTRYSARDAKTAASNAKSRPRAKKLEVVAEEITDWERAKEAATDNPVPKKRGRPSKVKLEPVEDEEVEVEVEEDKEELGWQICPHKERYAKVKSSRGNGSLDCSDEVAIALREQTLDEAYLRLSNLSKISIEDLQAKYKHLNNGLQRMNVGNRIRKLMNEAEGVTA